MKEETNSYVTRYYTTKNFKLTLNKKGADLYTKVSFPVRYGVYSEIETKDWIFQFNLNGQIRHARLKTSDWINPQEWLKRSAANDWIYYSTGGYTGVYGTIGEYYLPNLMYETNSLIGGKPFALAPIENLYRSWYPDLMEVLEGVSCDEAYVAGWMEAVRNNTPEFLKNKAEKLFEILFDLIRTRFLMNGV